MQCHVGIRSAAPTLHTTAYCQTLCLEDAWAVIDQLRLADVLRTGILRQPRRMTVVYDVMMDRVGSADRHEDGFLRVPRVRIRLRSV